MIIDLYIDHPNATHFKPIHDGLDKASGGENRPENADDYLIKYRQMRSRQWAKFWKDHTKLVAAVNRKLARNFQKLRLNAESKEAKPEITRSDLCFEYLKKLDLYRIVGHISEVLIEVDSEKQICNVSMEHISKAVESNF